MDSLTNTNPQANNPQASFSVPKDSTLMKSLINVNYCGAVYIDNSDFNENWLFEPELSNSRGMFMYLQQIYGMLLLKPGMSLK